MKIVLWLLFLLLAALWTGGAALTALAVQWAGNLAASGAAADLGQAAAQAPVPGWLALWGIDPALLRGVQEMLLWGLQALRDVLPAMGSAIGWLVPVVWVFWAIGLALLLVLAAGAHIAVGRFSRKTAAA